MRCRVAKQENIEGSLTAQVQETHHNRKALVTTAICSGPHKSSAISIISLCPQDKIRTNYLRKEKLDIPLKADRNPGNCDALNGCLGQEKCSISHLGLDQVETQSLSEMGEVSKKGKG